MKKFFILLLTLFGGPNGFAGTVVDFQTLQFQRYLSKYEGIFMRLGDLTNLDKDSLNVPIYRIAIVQGENEGPR